MGKGKGIGGRVHASCQYERAARAATGVTLPKGATSSPVTEPDKAGSELRVSATTRARLPAALAKVLGTPYQIQRLLGRLKLLSGLNVS